LEVLSQPHRVIAEKGTEAVNLKTAKREKESYTWYGYISSAREKLPFWVIIKGKTDLCHRKFRPTPDIIVRHTPNG
jgi:hypothetical protein